MFDSFHDVVEKMEAGNEFAKQVVHAWADADWFLNRPKLAEKISLTVFKVTGETNTDDLSPAPDAWARPDIPLHALAMLKNARDGIVPDEPGTLGPIKEIEQLKTKGFPLVYVGDVVGTGSSRKSATISVLWFMGDDIPNVPNKRAGGFCLGGKIAPIFYNTMEDSGALPIELDVDKEDSIKSAVKKIQEQKGRIDVLVNNAGYGLFGCLEDVSMDELKAQFETNFFGPINVIKAVLPSMRLQNSGLIINITSIAGYMGLPYRGVYSASKGALELVTEAFRMELKDFNIEVTNVAPGDFATNIAAGRYHAPVLEDSPYKEKYGYSLKMMDEHVDEGNDPIDMARAIHAIIQTKRPKIHYKVGAFMQKFSIVLKRILPDKVYEKLLMNHYKL